MNEGMEVSFVEDFSVTITLDNDEVYVTVQANDIIITADVAPVGGGIDGASWLDGDGEPDPELGVNRDFYIDNLTGNYYRKNNITWELKGKIEGKPGYDGLTPHIGENGNWYIGDTDTGIKAQGDDGDNGITPHIGENGNWYIGDTDTGVKALGEKGDTGPIGLNYTGDWDEGRIYQKNDAIQYGGAGYISLVNNNTAHPGIEGTWDKWSIFVYPGDQGIQGLDGQPGENGQDGRDGSNAPEVEIEYSINGSTNWHTPYTSGDKYLKVSVDGGESWSDVMKFIGEDGAAGPNQVTTDTNSNITGMLKGNGTKVEQAVAGTDYPTFEQILMRTLGA